MKRTRSIVFVLMGVLIISSLVSCAKAEEPMEADADAMAEDAMAEDSSEEDGSEGAAEDSNDDIRIYFDKCSGMWEIAYQWQYGAMQAAKELGIIVNTGAAEDASVEKNISLIEQAIAQEYDAIVSMPLVSDSYTVAYDKATEAGIPVFTYHFDAPQSSRVAFFGVDAASYARFSARYVADEMGKEGKVITIQGTASDTEAMIIDEFVKEINSYAPDIEVVAELNDTIDAAKSYEKITAVLQANPDVTGSFSCTGRGGADFAKIADDLGIEIVSNVTMDPLSFNVELLKEGKITGLVDQGPFDTGYTAVKAAYESIMNDGELVSYEEGINYLPDKIVNLENFDEYEEKIQAALDAMEN